MAKHRKPKWRRTPQHGHPRTERPPDLRLVRFASPFGSLSPEELDVLAQRIGQEGSRTFAAAFSELQERLAAFEPRSLLAGLSLYQLTMPPGKGTPRIGRDPLHQHHIELLQALILQRPLDTFPWMPTFPDLAAFVDLIDLASRMFFVRRIAPADDRQDGERRRIQEGRRLETQAVRNWGYPHQMRRITSDLFAPLDDRIQAELGVRVVDLLAMCRAIAESAYQRIEEHLRRTFPITKARTIPALCAAVNEATSGEPDGARTLELTLRALSPDITLNDAKEHLLHFFHLLTPDIYTFGLDDFVTAYPQSVDREALLAVLRCWSLCFGDLADQDAEHFFLNNPVWTQPLIRLEDDQFFCPIPDLFQSFGLQMMESLIREHPGLWEAYGQHRGRYLENETARQFAEAFPSATLFRGSTWRNPENPADEWENDLLVVLDAYVIVVEAKAGRMAERARRGDVVSLRQEITQLLVRPSEQSSRFVDYLTRHPQVHRFATRQGTENVVDTRAVRHVVRINVTLDPLGSFGSRWPALLDANLVTRQQELAATIPLADLQSIFELLEGQSLKLHYLVRRAEFERHAVYDGDEIDLLALYVQTGFNIGEVEFTRMPLSIEDMHENLEAFFMQRARGLATKRPQFAMTRWWKELVAMVEERQAPRWTLAALRLLNVPHRDQFRFEQRLKSHQHIVRTCWRNPGHQDMVWGTFGLPQRRQTFVGLAHRRLTKTEFREKVKRAGEIALEKAQTDDVVVIALDAEGKVAPASAVLHMSKLGSPGVAPVTPSEIPPRSAE